MASQSQIIRYLERLQLSRYGEMYSGMIGRIYSELIDAIKFGAADEMESEFIMFWQAAHKTFPKLEDCPSGKMILRDVDLMITTQEISDGYISLVFTDYSDFLHGRDSVGGMTNPCTAEEAFNELCREVERRTTYADNR